MTQLSGLIGLERLFIAKCGISDAGLIPVAELSELQVLNIYGTQITSVGLEHLSGLKNLRTLYITDLKLKTAAVDGLKHSLPELKVTDYTAE